MTLYELSLEYKEGARLLRERIALLKVMEKQARTEREATKLRARIRTLSSMLRDARAVAAHMEHYYERGRCRDARYIL